MQLNDAEAIDAYKSYAKNHLPQVDTLGGLWAPEFDPNAYPDRDYVSALLAYLDALDPYCNALNRAAYLRQYHYELFIQHKRQENDEHRAWREGMNRIAEDCLKKSQYWSTIHDRLLAKLIVDQELQQRRDEQRRAPVDVTIRNPDVDSSKPRTAPKVFNPKSITMRPPLSKQEKERRKREHKLWVKEKAARENQFIDDAIKVSATEIEEGQRLTKEAMGGEITDLTVTEFNQLCSSIGMKNPLTSPVIAIKKSVDSVVRYKVLQGTVDEYGPLFDTLITGLWTLRHIDDDRSIYLDGRDALSNYALIWKHIRTMGTVSYELIPWMMNFLIEAEGEILPIRGDVGIVNYFAWALQCMVWGLTDEIIVDSVGRLPDTPRKRDVIRLSLNLSLISYYIFSTEIIQQSNQCMDRRLQKMYVKSLEKILLPRPSNTIIRKKYGAVATSPDLTDAWRIAVRTFKSNTK